MRAGIARRSGRKHAPAVPQRSAYGVRARFLRVCRSLENRSSVDPVLIPEIPAGSHSQIGGGLGDRPDAGSQTKAPEVRVGEPPPARNEIVASDISMVACTKKEPRGRLAPGFRFGFSESDQSQMLRS